MLYYLGHFSGAPFSHLQNIAIVFTCPIQTGEYWVGYNIVNTSIDRLMDMLEETSGGGIELNTIVLWDLEYANGIVLLAQLGESLHLIGQEAAHISLVTDLDRTEFLAISIRQPPAPDYNQFSINLFLGQWDPKWPRVTSVLHNIWKTQLSRWDV